MRVRFASCCRPARRRRGASKELARIKGTVGYRAQADAPFQPVLGKLDLADDAWAVTEIASAAQPSARR